MEREMKYLIAFVLLLQFSAPSNAGEVSRGLIGQTGPGWAEESGSLATKRMLTPTTYQSPGPPFDLWKALRPILFIVGIAFFLMRSGGWSLIPKDPKAPPNKKNQK